MAFSSASPWFKKEAPHPYYPSEFLGQEARIASQPPRNATALDTRRPDSFTGASSAHQSRVTLHASRPVSAAKKRVENRIKVFATREEEDSPNDPNRAVFLPLFGDSTTMSMKSIKYEGKRSGCCTP
jgi:hypothetical protein